MFYIVQYNGYCIIKLLEIQKYIKDVKDLKYGVVTLQRDGVDFMTVFLRNTRTYLIGLRPANLLSLHFHFYFTLLYHCLPRSLRAAPPYYDYLEFLL